MAHPRMVFRERMTAIIGAVILFVLVALSYYYSIQTEIAGLRYVPSESSPDFTTEGVTLTDFTRHGVAKHRLFAESAAHFSDERVAAEKIRYVTLETTAPQIELTADQAWSNDGLETIDLAGNVEITREASEEEPDLYFRTERIRGYLDTHRFESTDPVFMRRGIDTIESEGGMTYDNVGHTVELKDRVRSVFHPQNFAAAP